MRIPVYTEKSDIEFPRTFALAQITEIDKLAETAKVAIHDLHGCKVYYGDVFRTYEFALNELIRCKAPKGSIVRTPAGNGLVMSISSNENSPYLTYHISMGNHGIKEYEERDIRADFTAIDVDPAEMLMRYEFQNPSWFACRNIVSSIMHVLNNAVYGFKVVAGCRVFLLPHQVVTIVRCLERDPVRYMLADEVGLGKTIEACSIIKIMQERNQALRVLYILPMPLIDQWKFELMSKFSIDVLTLNEASVESKHVVISIQELVKLNGQAIDRLDFDIVVVDETHQMLADDLAYDYILRLSRKIEHILLLSATPIQDRKEEYLRLLSLLDPGQYIGMSTERFNELVEKQQEIQRELYMLLGDMQSYSDFAESIIEQLKSLAGNLQDNRLKALIESIDIQSEDLGQEKVYQAAAYISEHYRLERHIIRNRRALLQQQMPQRRLIERPYTMVGLNELYGEADAIYNLIQWLQDVNDHTDHFAETVVRPLLTAAFSSPWSLNVQLDALVCQGIKVPIDVMDAVKQWVGSADGEIERTDELLDENPDDIKGRLLQCMDYLEQETGLNSSKPYKVLVFTSYVETLKAFLGIARHRLSNEACVAFYRGMTPDELQESAKAFQSNPDCRLLICDELGGEGRNFQMADVVVHLDTPWSANILEQRIGRLDRLGRDITKPVTSIVFFAEGTIEEQLVSLWKDGMGIYTQSLSGLEIITGEVAKHILDALKENASDGLTHTISEIQSETIRMREAVEEEQFYDMASMLYRPLTVGVERMLSMYQGKEDEIFSEAMISWSKQAGLQPTSYIDRNGKPVTEFSARNFSPASSMNALLVPPDWRKYYGFQCEKIATANNQQKINGTFNRSYAINREDLHFYAPNDPVFDSIISNAMTSYRGRACAAEIKNAPFDFTGLVFIWNVEPNMKPIIDNNLDPVILAQFRSFLPMEQIVTLYPLDDEMPLVSTDDMIALLAERHIIRKAEHLGRRSNSEKGAASIRMFMAKYPPSFWIPFVKEGRSKCQKEARRIVTERWDYDIALEEARRIVSAHQASNRYFGYDEEQNEKIRTMYKAVLLALKNYHVTMDSAAFMRVHKNEYR
ncbi:SNF2-related protein [Desulfosporosinus shakirovi]|uniref:SNF2-related protein n=1 Tax=Desulfosporosinus shakirovi TaxID=2885154 RepID=UPI001E3B428A|nr:SNF2-related protein [Desulfosporosinus sp. SRJS8]